MKLRAGFTLIELLVAGSIMALVGGACVAALTGGVHVWQRAMQQGTDDESTIIAFERMRRDLQNVRRFAPIPPEGSVDQYAFAAVDHGTLEGPEELGQMGYFVDARRRLLCRGFVPYPRMERSRLRDECQPVLEGVTRLQFAYFGMDEKGKNYEWAQSWHSAEPPNAVKVSIVVEGTDRQPHTHSFLVSVMSVPIDEES